MALREFTDEKGGEWKVWDVTADQIHPKTKAEDYMHDLAEGWLVFEHADGEEKRRLCPYPEGWELGSDDDLLALLARAEKVKRRTPSSGVWKIGDTPLRPEKHRDAAPPASTRGDVPRRPRGDDGTDAPRRR